MPRQKCGECSLSRGVAGIAAGYEPGQELAVSQAGQRAGMQDLYQGPGGVLEDKVGTATALEAVLALWS